MANNQFLIDLILAFSNEINCKHRCESILRILGKTPLTAVYVLAHLNFEELIHKTRLENGIFQ